MLTDIYWQEIHDKFETAFRGLAKKNAPVCICLDLNGAYEMEMPWDENNKDIIACIGPIPDSFRVSHEALEVLLAEMAQPGEIEKLLPLETLSLSELKLSNPALHGKILEEIVQMTCDEALKNFDDILRAYAARRGAN